MNKHLSMFLAKGTIFRTTLKHAWTTKGSTTNPVPFKFVLPIANFLSTSVSCRNNFAKTACHSREGS